MICMLDSRIKDLIDGLDVKVKYSSELDVEGTYLASLNWIIINSNLSEVKQYEVLLHELGHAALQRGEIELYHATQTEHLKMEAEANTFMLKETLSEYVLDNSVDIRDINPVTFLEVQGLSLNLEPKLRKILKENI